MSEQITFYYYIKITVNKNEMFTNINTVNMFPFTKQQILKI